MRRYRATKIIATLGPSSSDAQTIEQLFLSGVDLFRLNFSHGTYEVHEKNFQIIRALEEKYGRPIGIIQDLQGPKLRVGKFEGGSVVLEDGQTFTLDLTETLGSQERVNLPHPEIFQALRVGSELLLDDGNLRLKVEECDGQTCRTIVLNGGPLSNHKGVNVPGVTLPIDALTEKDLKDLDYGLKLGVDWVALSFVQRPEDVEKARQIIGDRAAIASKIEKPMALQQLDKIIRLSDGIMIARGDLGVEMLPEDVPSVQKKIIAQCRLLGRPVIVATQMLESMVTHRTPTRAEASDVATAVYEGVDAVMLSAESAAGKYPVETVTMMNRIIERVEKDPAYRNSIDYQLASHESTVSDAITAAARTITDTLSLKAMVTLTTSGSTAVRVSRERPNAPIIGLTPDYLTAHILTLTWGVHPILIAAQDEPQSFEDVIAYISKAVVAFEFAEKGDEILITMGSTYSNDPAEKVFKTGSTRGVYIQKV